MRKLLMAVVTLISTGLLASTGAEAAARWTCEGPEYVCGPATSPVAKSSEDASERKAARTRAVKADRPAKAARAKQDVASAADDDKPARRRNARAQSNDDNSGGATYSGAASYYWQPQKLASGGYFNPNAYTAAHKTLPFGTRVRVTNQRNGQSVDVVINDRGPYIAGRIIDLSKAAAYSINMQNSGVVPVSVRVLGRG
jgi:rare lipoprotein A